MEVNLKIIGCILIVLALIHAIFPKYFNWSNELNSISLVNRQMMYIHTFFIALILFLMGLLCLTSSGDIVNTKLGNKIALGLGFFWMIRLLIQFFGYSSELWKGKKMESSVHIIFSILWMYFSSAFIYIAFKGIV